MNLLRKVQTVTQKHIALAMACAVLFVSPFSVQAVDLPDNYPLTANYFLDPQISDAEARELSKWDLVIVGMGMPYSSPNAIRIMKERNPDIIVLAYVASEEFGVDQPYYPDKRDPTYKLYSQFQGRDDIFLKTGSGAYTSVWPGTRIVNVTKLDWQVTLTDFMSNQVLKKDPDLWDGIFYDNCFNDIAWAGDGIDINGDGSADPWQYVDEQWRAGMTSIMRRTRNLNPDKLIVCNSSGEYYTYINGRLMEAFPNDPNPGWPAQINTYLRILREANDPTIVIVNTVNNSSDSRNYRLMRYNLTSTLLGNGFASFDESVSNHASLWWYDEYEASLGQPIGGLVAAQSGAPITGDVRRGVIRRNFERGIVIVNSTDRTQFVQLEQGYEKLLGTQDTIVNDGRIVGSVTLQPNDGVILLGRLDRIDYGTYVNGTFANVFNKKGKHVRNSFFAYDSRFSGNNMIATYPDKKAVVVADDTYVTVYRNGRQTAKFAPYGEHFNLGVNIAVDKMWPKKKGVQIVTGTRSGGAHVRIFNLKGQLINPGCFPYPEQFRGGVNVAIGDVKKNNKGKEIVAGAGYGGGPQVQILSRDCKKVTGGFFAYDERMRAGVKVAAGNVDNKGHDEIVTIPGAGIAPHVQVFNGNGKPKVIPWYAFDPSDGYDRQIAVSDVDGNGKYEIVVMSFNIFAQ